MNDFDLIPSEEQQNIIDSLKNNDVVKVQAVAGSGKSTTVFLCAKQNPDKKIIVITYNKSLKDEMNKKAKKYKINNITIYTFHGLATYILKKSNHFSNYLNYINNDEKLNEWLKNEKNIHYIKQFLNLDILVGDEFQDCNQIYWKFLTILLKTHPKTKLLILGDFRQTIYEFKESHDWWLNNINKLIPNKKVDCLKLTTSYRLPKNISYFLNNYCFDIDSSKINSIKNNNIKVQYWHFNNIFDINELNKIVSFIKNNQKYKPQDIFIINDNLSSGNKDIITPIKLLENLLVQNDIAVFFPDDDERNIKNSVSNNKVIFCTPWTAKGRERKLVFYLSFGYNFDVIYNRQTELKQIDNKTYVGLTRALEELIIINYSDISVKKRKSFKFINYQKMLNDDLIEIPEWSKQNLKQDLQLEFKELNNKIPKLNLIGSKIGKYLPTNIEIKINSLINEIAINQNQKIESISIPLSTSKQNNLIQDVSAINSILFTSISVDKLKGIEEKNKVTNETLDKTLNNFLTDENDESFKNNIDEILESKKSIIKLLEKDNKNIVELSLLKSTIIYCISNKLLNPVKQIEEYSWLNNFNDWEFVKNRTIETIKKSSQYLSNELNLNLILLEVGIQISYLYNNEICNIFRNWIKNEFDGLIIEKFNLVGIFDLVIQDLFFEFKFTSSLTIENKIQVVFYLFLLNLHKNQKNVKFKIPNYFHLFNIKTNEWIIIKNDEKIVNEIIKLLIQIKLKEKYEIPDDFIQQNKIDY